jgi:exodeoxyribonuclease VII large subunit
MAVKDPSMLLGHLAQRLDDLEGRASRSIRHLLIRNTEKAHYLNDRLALQSPLLRLERNRESLLVLQSRLEKTIGQCLERSSQAVAFNAGKLQALSPLATLARGYAIVRKATDGSVINESRRLTQGDVVNVTFRQGGAVCRVESTDK